MPHAGRALGLGLGRRQLSDLRCGMMLLIGLPQLLYCVEYLAQARILENLIQNVLARAARENFAKICATTGNSQDHRQRPKAYTMRVYPGGCTSPAQPSQRHDGNTGRSRGPPPPAGKTKTAIASVFTGPSSCVNAFKRAVNAFGEAVLVNCDLPTEPDTIKIFQKSASLAQNLRIKICGEMNQNPGLGQRRCLTTGLF